MKLCVVVGFASVAFSAVAGFPGVARAQEAVTTQETTSQAAGPSMAMVGSGIVIFGLSYIPAVVVASESGTNADRTLFVPLAGPWIDLTQRPGCGPNASCNSENAAKVGLVVDGVFQAIGALTVLGGFLTTSHETRTVQRSTVLHPTVHFTPAQVGTSGYGMAALGTF